MKNSTIPRNHSHLILAFLVVSLITLAPGCASSKKLRSDVGTLQTDVDSLSLQLRRINETLARQLELLRLARADQQVQSDEMKGILENLGMTMSENRDRLSHIDKKTQSLKRGLDERMLADSLAGAAKLAETESLFDVAMADFNAGRRSVAQAGFEDIVRRFGGMPRSEEALYWIGECQYAQKLKSDAEKTYIDYIKKFPSGTEFCPALFKLGLIYNGNKKTDNRNAVWGKLIETCPGSEEAEIAKSKMKK